MNIPIEQFIPSGAGLIATLAGLAGMWFKFQHKVETLERDRDEYRKDSRDERTELRRQIDAFWEWKDDHDKQSSLIRERFNKDIAHLEGANLVVNEQFKQIVGMLEEIKERMSELERK